MVLKLIYLHSNHGVYMYQGFLSGILAFVISLVPLMAGAAELSESIKTWLEKDKSVQKIGRYLIQVDSVKKIYERNHYQPIWIEGGSVSLPAKEFLEILNNPNEFGFAKSDFVDPQLQQILSREKTTANLFWFEILMTDKFVQMIKYLNQGRLADYYILDDDTKLPKKSFERWDELAEEISVLSDAGDVYTALEKFEPKNRIYRSLKTALARFLKIQREGTWKALALPKEKLEKQDSHEFIQDLKIQLSHLGFDIETIDSRYDDNLAAQLEMFHKQYRSSEKGITASLVRAVSGTIESKIERLFTAMEKARMLPNLFEPNYIFVNLAFQEFKLFENNQLAMAMKTINGQKFRRTPTMKDVVTVVELNPTWTVPQSIAIKDKLAKIKANPSYLFNHNMSLYDNLTSQLVDPESIDWSTINKTNFNFTIVQGSGNDNALGLVKFPLTNPWAIYLHDTNERNLFGNAQRALSSGCIRLEKPFLFAQYLLRDQPSYTIEKINSIVKYGLDPANDPKPTRIKVKRTLPVYTSFITTDVTDEGVIRFADDVYGSDSRLNGILQSKDSVLLSSAAELAAPEWIEGSLMPDKKSIIGFLGNPSESQISKIVKLYKCVKNKRNSCVLAHTLDFNKNYLVDSGDYVAVFENQIFAEIMTLAPKAKRTVKLAELKVPPAFSAEKRVRLFHDMSSTTEQQRVLIENFYFEQSPLKFSQYDFGDFYLSSLGLKVMNERIDYGLCVNSKGLAFSEEATDVCSIYRAAKSPDGLRALFIFGAASLNEKYSDGEFSQYWVTRPGDRVKLSHKRRLVSAPMDSNENVLVFPGTYKFKGEQSGKTIALKAVVTQ